jgi:ribosomal protein S1
LREKGIFGMSDEELQSASAEAGPAEMVSTVEELRPKMKVAGTVRRLELYGAIIELAPGVNAILHISKLGSKVNRIADALSVGDQVEVWVEKLDREKGQVTVTMLEPIAVEWSDLHEGMACTGRVTRLEPFGAFVDIGAEKEGLVHVSELSHDYVRHPSEVVKVGDEVEVKVLTFNKRKRRIDLSRKALLENPAAAPRPAVVQEPDPLEEEDEEMPTAMEMALRQAMGDRPGGHRRASRPKSQRRDYRRQQDDILDRTLRMGQEK